VLPQPSGPSYAPLGQTVAQSSGLQQLPSATHTSGAPQLQSSGPPQPSDVVSQRTPESPHFFGVQQRLLMHTSVPPGQVPHGDVPPHPSL